MRVLILEADRLAGAALANTVRRHLADVHVDTALSFHAGLKHLAVTPYDAVLTDATLPDAPSVRALSVLNQRYQDTPVILMSAQCGRDVMANATLNGVYHVLHKPIEEHVLIAMLSRVLQEGRLGREIQQLTTKANRHTKRAKKAIAYARLLLEAKDRLLSRCQDALAQSEESRDGFEHALNRVSYGVLVFDRSWRLLWMNAAAPPIFRLKPRDQWLGKRVWEVWPNLAASAFQKECHRAAEARLAVQFQACFPKDAQEYDAEAVPHGAGVSVFLTPAGGSLHRLPKISHDRPHACSTATGIEGSLRHNEQVPSKPETTLPRVAEQLQMAREAERTRIARDLQDDLGRHLEALQTDLTWLDVRLREGSLPILLKVRFMAHLVGRMTHAVNRISRELRPAILDELGLAGAMQWQASTLEHRTGLRCIVSIKGIGRLTDGPSTGLFRIFQELLTDVARHVAARTVWVTLKEEAAWLVLEVTHNGRGLTKADTDVEAHGLSALQERAHQLGGELSLDGLPGQGATVTVRIPAPTRDTNP